MSVTPGLERVEEGLKYPPYIFKVPPVEAAVEAGAPITPYDVLVPVVITPVTLVEVSAPYVVSAVVDELQAVACAP